MNNEGGKELNEKSLKENSTENLKNISFFNPINEKLQQEIHMHSQINSLPNSGINNFKSEIRVEPANLFL
jgi:hypothetical protein